LIPRSLLRKELSPDFLESVIPNASIGGSTGLTTGETGTGLPINDAFVINSHRDVLIARQLAAGYFNNVTLALDYWIEPVALS
jgi:hypothetical protein